MIFNNTSLPSSELVGHISIQVLLKIIHNKCYYNIIALLLNLADLQFTLLLPILIIIFPDLIVCFNHEHNIKILIVILNYKLLRFTK